MARNGTTFLYTATPGSGQATAMRSALAGAGFSTIAVGSLYTWGSGVNERNYFTLTFVSGAEILVCIPNGTSMYRDNMYVEVDTLENNWQMPLMFVYSANGGFESALSNTIDPDTSAFKTHITDTLGFREPGIGVPMLYWRSGGPSMQVHFIEDNLVEFLGVYVSEAGAIGGNTYMSCMLFSNEMFTNASALGVHPEGMFYVTSVNDSTKSYRYQRSSGWDLSDDSRILIYAAIGTEYNTVQPMYRDSAAATIPPASGNLPAWPYVLYSPTKCFQINPLLLKKTSINFSTFKTLIGTSTDYKYTRIIQGYLTPWDNSQALPT